jgi:hypothetical protein
MNWILMYLMMTFTGQIVQTGMHTTGPFQSELTCNTYAKATWDIVDWIPQNPGRNMYDSTNWIQHLEHKDSNATIFWTCVEIRNPDKWRNNKS